MNISTEITSYIYNRINHQKETLNLNSILHYFILPHRATVNYENYNKIPQKHKLDIAIRGTIRIEKENKAYFNYKISFAKKINSIFFQKLIDDLNNEPEITFDFSEKNLQLEKFIHEALHISTLFQIANLLEHNQSSEAETLIQDALKKLIETYKNPEIPSIKK